MTPGQDFGLLLRMNAVREIESRQEPSRKGISQAGFRACSSSVLNILCN